MKLNDMSDKIEATNVGLAGSKFDDVNLSGSSFNNINLSETKFHDVNMTNVKIDYANLEGMTIKGVLVSDLFAAYEAVNAKT